MQLYHDAIKDKNALELNNISHLAQIGKITKSEALKKQVSIGNVREIISIVSDMLCCDSSVILSLVNNGKRRAKIKAKKHDSRD